MPAGAGLLIGGRRSSGSAFTPASLAGLTSWFRADLGHAPVSDGTELSSLLDQSGAGVLPSIATFGANHGPTFVASGINGKPDMDWSSGASTVLAGSSPTAILGTTGVTLFAVVRTTNTAAGRIYGMQYNAFHYLLAVNYSGGLGDGIASYLTADFTEARSDAPINDGNPHVVIGCWSTSDNTGRIYVDGPVAAATTAASATQPAPGGGDVNAAGAGSDGASVFQTYTGRLPEFGSYLRALDGVPADLAALLGYLKAEYGVP